MKNSMIVAGLVAVATAAPTSPSADAAPSPFPACTEWKYTGPMNIFQDNALIVMIDKWWGDTAGTALDNATLSRTDGSQVLVGDHDFKSQQTGTAQGGNSGNRFDLTVDWGGGLTNHYVGTFDNFGSITGTSTNSKGVKNAFHVEEHFTCAQQQAAPPANPAPAPYQQHALAIGNVDAWDIAHDDTPDPKTGVRGAKVGTFKNGQEMVLQRPCADGWCLVNSGFLEPRGYGFVKQSQIRFDTPP